MCMSNARVRRLANESAEEADYGQYLLEEWDSHLINQAEAFTAYKKLTKSRAKHFVNLVKAVNEVFTMLIDLDGCIAEKFSEFAEGGLSRANNNFKEFVEEYLEELEYDDEYTFRENVATEYATGYADYCYDQAKDEALGL